MNSCGGLATGVIVLCVCLLLLQLALLVATRGQSGWRLAARGWEATAKQWQKASDANEQWAKAEQGLSEQRLRSIEIWKGIAVAHGYKETTEPPPSDRPPHLNS